MKEQIPTYELLSGSRSAGVKPVYERYGRKLFLFAQNKWKMNEDDAWDLVYKTLYRVIEKHSEYTFTNEEKFSAFVFTVFINYLRNFYRDRKNIPEEIRGIDEQIATHEPQEATTVSPAMKLLQDELDKLEEWERILLLMRSQDISYSEIAKYVSKPEEQLKVYYQRLKKKLGERMNLKIQSSETSTHGTSGK